MYSEEVMKSCSANAFITKKTREKKIEKKREGNFGNNAYKNNKWKISTTQKTDWKIILLIRTYGL